MAESNLFEQMLAAYPAEKRDLARAVYRRFAGGESTEFFTQLFLVLDVYAHYAERIPKAVVEANENSLAARLEPANPDPQRRGPGFEASRSASSRRRLLCQ